MSSIYHKKIRSEIVDVYDILEAFDVFCPAIQHAVKKLLMAGRRGVKSRAEDLREASDAIQRAIEIESERVERQ